MFGSFLAGGTAVRGHAACGDGGGALQIFMWVLKRLASNKGQRYSLAARSRFWRSTWAEQTEREFEPAGVRDNPGRSFRRAYRACHP